MGVPWYQCADCIFGSNSAKSAAKHAEEKPDHHVTDDDEAVVQKEDS